MTTTLKHPKMTALVLLLSAFMCAADTATLMPIIDLLSTEVFPQYSYGTVSMIMSASAIALAVISLLTGALTKAGKKRLLLIGSFLFTAGGLAGMLIPNLYYMIATRIVEGIGAGLVMTISLMMIPTLFREQKDVDRLMGINGIFMAAFTGIITFTSGYMALVNWKLPFLYYGAGIIILLLQWIYLPDDHAMLREDAAPGSRFTAAGLRHGLSGFAFGVFTSFFFICISGVLAENGVGNAASAGTAATFNTVGSFLSGFVFAAVFNKLKQFSFGTFYLIIAAACFGIVSVSSMPLVCLCAVFNGVGWNLFFSAYLAKVSMFSDAASLDANMALSNGAYYIGQFVTPFAMSIISSVSGNASTVFAMKCVLAVLLILSAIHFLCAFIGRHQTTPTA